MYCLYFLIYFSMSLPTTQPLVIRKSLIVHNQPVPSNLFAQKVSLYPPTSFCLFSRGEPFTPPALMHSSDTSYIEADYLSRNTYLCVNITYREHIIVLNAFIFRQRPYTKLLKSWQNHTTNL